MSSDAEVGVSGATPAGETLSSKPTAAERSAWLAFVVVEIVGFFTYLVVGRFMWFYGDDWSALAGRTLGDALRQHGGHMIALPVVVFRLMFFVFGLRSYTPYLVMIVSLHVVVAALLRVIMRRAGVAPWVATAASAAYVFFGAGGQDVLWAFQITFVGAVVFGLLQLVLSDHGGPIDRRDWFGLLCGLLSLMCAGVSITMIAVVGIAAVIRGRWRAALFHTVPLGVLWVLWSARYGRNAKFATRPSLLFDWDRRGIGHVFRSLGYGTPVGWALAAVLIGGLGLVLKQAEPGWRSRAAVPLAALVGVLIFFTLTGSSRAFFGLSAAGSSRYLDVATVLVLPALAVAANALAVRHRAVFALVIVLFLVGIPGNISHARDPFPHARYFSRYRQMMLSLPRMSLAKGVPGSLHPEPNQAPDVTVSWLLENARAGRIPKPRASTSIERATNILRLSLDQSLGSAGSSCQPVEKPRIVELREGQAFSVRGTVVIRSVGDGVVSDPVVFGAGLLTGSREHKLVDVGSPLTLRVSGTAHRGPASLCGLPPARR